MPAKAGIQKTLLNHWIPAFAGMTTRKRTCLFRDSLARDITHLLAVPTQCSMVLGCTLVVHKQARARPNAGRCPRNFSYQPIVKRRTTRQLPRTCNHTVHTGSGGTRIANTKVNVPLGFRSVRLTDAGPREAIQPALDTRRDKSPGDPTRGFGDPDRGDPLAVSYHPPPHRNVEH